ncbi:MAG: hypothetical protein IJ809_02005, partial [Clostridia bacterium]|nr:hypothetical protein [Clostridia bacterium]
VIKIIIISNITTTISSIIISKSVFSLLDINTTPSFFSIEKNNLEKMKGKTSDIILDVSSVKYYTKALI